MRRKLIPPESRFGMLTTVEIIGQDSGKHYLQKCLCDCGNTVIRAEHSLMDGSAISCGCSWVRGAKHGMTKTRIYNICQGIRRRCNDPKTQYYSIYGGRGIKVCKEWNDFKIFHRWALENGYNYLLTIDRIDNDGGYEPSNCRWVTMAENNKNRH